MDSSALRAANRLRALLREQAPPPLPLPLPLPLTLTLSLSLSLSLPLTLSVSLTLAISLFLREQGASPLKMIEARSWGDRALEEEGGKQPPPNPNPNPP